MRLNVVALFTNSDEVLNISMSLQDELNIYKNINSIPLYR